jgi:FkbM family methyltransferase
MARGRRAAMSDPPCAISPFAATQASMNALTLHLSDGTAIAVPASLDAITTYVLLEQEAWFEKETAVVDWFKPGDTVIDIGANLGVYSLPLARRIAPDGHIYAYEPASEARRFLERSRTLNRLDNLEIVAAAVSDRPREGRLVFADSAELHHLSTTNEPVAGETVRIVSLDEEAKSHAWQNVAFIKIDAEGEEHRILDGGREFFARHSPLVMFECKARDDIDHAIAERFRKMGYGVFRLLHGAPLLVPVEQGEALDPHQLNLFAAKPDRTKRLAQDGHLIETQPPPWQPDEKARAAALDILKQQTFAAAFRSFFTEARLDQPYLDALAGYAAWRSDARPPAERYAALCFAHRTLHDLCENAATPARLTTLARCAGDLGLTVNCLDALNRVCRMGQQGQNTLDEPFWPANPRFETIPPEPHAGAWFVIGIAEQLERSTAYSSTFSTSPSTLDWLIGQPFVSAEMHRRRLLKYLKQGKRLSVPARLLVPGPDHINAEVWRAGLVPNSLPPTN